VAEAAAGGILPPARIAFLGLGKMGLPMARRLLGAGYDLRGFDLAAPARAAFVEAGGAAAASPAEAAEGCAALITMLPDGAAVEAALFGGVEPLAPRLPRGTLVIDMSSSAPLGTRALAERLAALGIPLVDAPVSGGVKRAVDGSLAIMAGGDPENVGRARPLFEAMGKAVFATGAVGSGHAMKALNNYVSAAGLVAACEALQIGAQFGLDPALMTDVLNASTGRNNSTENKLKPFVLSGSFASGFALALMAKDLRIADDLARDIGVPAPLSAACSGLWAAALAALGPGADHTEIDRYLASLPKRRGDANHQTSAEGAGRK
jgi:3-hydroxyisobutyrate dehydrogenase